MDRPLEISFAIVCDDVRREDNGKLILIGVYGENIVLPQIPAPMVLCVVLFIETKEEFRTQGTFRARMEDQILAEAPINLDYKKGKGIVSYSGIPVAIQKAGNLTFELEVQGEGKARILKTIPVTFALASESPASAS
jgi:hypothetical protein